MTFLDAAGGPDSREDDDAGEARGARVDALANPIARILLRAGDEAQMLNRVCHALVEGGACTMAWIGLAEHDAGHTLHPVARAGEAAGVLAAADDTWADCGWGRGPTGVALRSGHSVVIRHIADSTDPDLSALRADAWAHGYGAVCALPLCAGEVVLGALTLLDRDPNVFAPAEVSELARLAQDVAFGLTGLRARLGQQQTTRRLDLVDRALRTLSAGNRVLLRCHEESQLLAEMCRCIVETGGYRMTWVGYAQHDTDKTILPMAHAGIDAGVFEQLKLTWADTPEGQIAPALAIRSGKSCVWRDFTAPSLPATYRDAALSRGYTAVAAFPLMIEGEVFGTLDIVAGEPDAFGEDELAVLSELAADLSFGIASLRMRAKHREAERTIERMAFVDPLTGLPNRARLRDRLTREIGHARERNHPLAVLTLNVDRFREINEVLGYELGDTLLAELADRLQKRIEPPAMLARVGVDEFAILLPRADAVQAEATARDLAGSFSEPFQLAETRVEIRASFGIATFPDHGAEADLLILRSDAAMYQSKRKRKCVEVFSVEAEYRSRERLGMMTDLRHAIDGHELRLYCQPKVSMDARAVCGAEALVRWQHPERGLIAPDLFVPLAERTGLINPLTYWVLDAALSQCYTWRREGVAVPLAINLSARTLLDPRLIDRLTGLLTIWGADPDWLQFELTESTLMEDPAGSLEVLRHLQAMGFQLHVDDFGTGYSSLAYLQKLPISAVKIDKSFVMGMMTDPDSAVIVDSTIGMVHNIGLEVVAEGTASLPLWERLARLGADVAQGTYISDPFPAEGFREWRAHSNWLAGELH